ncbi:Zinc finger protein ZOP1 [Vanrija pseudolonga]|uniref:Zinc finger protein ZOP1 n=1 Tax=Vanrija pseudolonga TaxID=143232 RepID=A0AAF0XZ90_9TREE|nr:Zinc finger protein ZOP1 [Vanrija pseudolonga]
MSEYWVSKKQYWCKYCSIFIRDDAPSKRLHESGLKHQGNKERFIRDLYKGGERAKRDKEIEAQEYARIEAAAKSAHAKDKGMSAPAPAPRRVAIASSSRTRTAPSGDKFANYSSAAQLGFDDEETQLSSYEIEQMVRGRGTAVGAWEEVVEPKVVYGADGLPELKRKADEAEVVDEDDPDSFKFSHRDKRPVRDVWDDDDWDPKAALSGLKLKSKGSAGDNPAEAKPTPAPAAAPVAPGAALDRSAWSGKLELGAGSSGAAAARAEGESESKEDKPDAPDAAPEPKAEDEAKPADAAQLADSKPDVKPGAEAAAAVPASAEPAAEPAAPSSMFKKRRPPPSSRKK